ncbi:hypothetical protein [Chitinophaga ginsengisoli]|uniref:Secreted protein (Por secretion system target) n=1 Tax=Chitinophaga ginsengisoli TaxID=363837 RepID=A0A2P8FTQ5_9BACT|nr:hypothetical protein [Chitinophaga ginsengisoli]PSL25015.1 hypothetical protein CLV42_114164 [Chitinophaga ginsengisoli]
MRRSLTFISLAVVVMAGCSKKNAPAQDCVKYEKVHVTRIDKASAGKDGATTVYFNVNNGCGQFHQFNEKKSGNTRTITVEAVYKGCMCTMDIPERKASYKLTEKTPGTYYLKFVSGENDYQIDTVVIK